MSEKMTTDKTNNSAVIIILLLILLIFYIMYYMMNTNIIINTDINKFVSYINKTRQTLDTLRDVEFIPFKYTQSINLSPKVI